MLTDNFCDSCEDYCDPATLGESEISYTTNATLFIIVLNNDSLKGKIWNNDKFTTVGYAYVAGACDRNATKKSSEAVGIVEDNGGFAGIIPTAHEIGHL